MGYRLVAYLLNAFICFWLIERSVSCTVYDLNGHNRSNVFECNAPVVLSCNVPKNTPVIQWFIAETLTPSPSAAASCLGPSCTPINDFAGRYAYAYNDADGVCNITITNVTMGDGILKYRCDDGTVPPEFKPTIKVFPNNATTHISYSISQGLQSITVTTDCTVLSDNITFIWEKTKNANGTERTPLRQDDVEYSEKTESSDCATTDKCGKLRFSNTLRFKPGNDGDGYYIHCSVIVKDEFGPAVITRISSQAYQFKDTTTISTTTSSSSLPPSSTDNFTTSSSKEPTITKRGTEQNPNADKTSTILIIAFSLIAGIALLLLVVWAINKIRKNCMKQSGASNNHEMETETNNQ